MNIDLLLEAEKRGILPEDKKALLEEARKRGLVKGKPSAKEKQGSKWTPYLKDALSPFKGGVDTIANIIASEGVPGGKMPVSPQSNGFSLKNTIANVPASTANTLQGLREAASDPVGTAETLGKTAIGTGQLLYPGEQDYEKYPMALYKHYRNIGLKDIEENPVGTGADFYGLLRGGAGIVKNAARGGAKLLPKTLPSEMYQRGAKFSTTMPRAQRAAITETALKGKFMPTDAGVEKLNLALSDYNTKVNALINNATDKGFAIHRNVVKKNLKELKADIGGVKIEGAQDVGKVNKIIGKFEAHLDKQNKTWITPRELQDFKTDLYEKIHWDAKRMRGSPVKDKAYRNIARSAKEGVERMVPEVGPLNKKYGSLLDLKDALQQSAGRIGNRDIFSLTDVTAAGFGSHLGGVPGGILGGVANLARRPTPSSSLAIKLYGLQNPSSGLLRLKQRDALLGLLQAGNIEGQLSR